MKKQVTSKHHGPQCARSTQGRRHRQRKLNENSPCSSCKHPPQRPSGRPCIARYRWRYASRSPFRRLHTDAQKTHIMACTGSRQHDARCARGAVSRDTGHVKPAPTTFRCAQPLHPPPLHSTLVPLTSLHVPDVWHGSLGARSRQAAPSAPGPVRAGKPPARTHPCCGPPSLLGTHPNTVSGAPSTAFESGSSPRSYPSIQMRHDWRLSLQVEMVGCLPQSRALHALALHGRSGTGRNSHPQVYLACWVTSIFLICFLSDAP